MADLKYINENGLHLLFEITDDLDVRLLHFSSYLPPQSSELLEESKRRSFRLVEVHFSGENQNDHHDMKHTGTMPGNRLKLIEWTDNYKELGRKIEIKQVDMETSVEVTSHLQFYTGIAMVRSWTDVENKGNTSVGLEYVSSFVLSGIDKEGHLERQNKVDLHIPHNTWYGESQWQSYRLADLGFHHVNDFSMKRISINSLGTWSSSQYAPLAIFENHEIKNTLFWQIEHNGSWHWEISDMKNLLYLHLSGPTEQEHHWWKNLERGESFSSIPIAIGSVEGSFQQAIEQFTTYRRTVRRPNQDNLNLPVIFNDYMNCLFGDPTTEKEIPMIDAAAEVGCEYYCIDCGWYADGEWWDGVGEWIPSEKRFPGGIKEVLDYIRNKGMVPGLWLELEVMGINCELASKVPDDWFFNRHGIRVIDHSRYQLDYRNPKVRQFADSVIKRLVEEYGVGYIKMDYNINAGVGTEINADSFGDGLLEHNRAYLRWLDKLFEKYPNLVVENCGSGGMRMDYALLSRHSIQSTSDQTDYLKNAVIAAGSSSLVTPEQAAVWSYPLQGGDKEEVILNMVNSLLLRIHQSGHLAELTSESFELVREGINYHKSIRHNIANGLPFWPLGTPTLYDDWICFGIIAGDTHYVAVWRLNGDGDSCKLAIPNLHDTNVEIKLGYPTHKDSVDWSWDKEDGTLNVNFPIKKSARLFEVKVI